MDEIELVWGSMNPIEALRLGFHWALIQWMVNTSVTLFTLDREEQIALFLDREV